MAFFDRPTQSSFCREREWEWRLFLGMMRKRGHLLIYTVWLTFHVVCKTLELLHIFGGSLRCSVRWGVSEIGKMEHVSAMKLGGGWRCIVVSLCLRIEKQKQVLKGGWEIAWSEDHNNNKDDEETRHNTTVSGIWSPCLATISTSCSAVIRFIGFVQPLPFRNCISCSRVAVYRPIQL